MYHFSYFKENDKQVLLQFLRDYPFALITGSDADGKPVATQIPFLIEERNGELYLQAHIMRNTDHHKAFEKNADVLTVFTGPNCYVSASWYSNQQMGSTWNYMSAHISGKLRFMSDDELVAFMKKFTLHFEGNNTASPTVFDNLPADYLNKMLKGIVGLEIRAGKIENVFKLSQNRDEKSYDSIIAKLNEKGGSSAMVADEMKKRRAQLFPPGVEWDSTKFDS